VAGLFFVPLLSEPLFARAPSALSSGERRALKLERCRVPDVNFLLPVVHHVKSGRELMPFCF
jgi:hypothetical protein